jgi:predicted metal-dependent hydrolase
VTIEPAQLQFGQTAIPYRVTRSRKRRRTIEIAIDASGRVSVAAPVWTPAHEIDDFVRRKAGWIRRQIATPPAPPQVQPERTFAAGETLPFLGRQVVLDVQDIEGIERASARLAGDVLEVRLPTGRTGEARDASVREAIERWYRARARVVFAERVAHFAAIAGVSPKRVLVRAQKTRWGSCGRDGTLRLNWHLMLAPTAVVDYIVVHELCHLRRGGHGKAFWQLVERVLPEYRAAKAELRRAGLTYRF